jgi:hypothetical protein
MGTPYYLCSGFFAWVAERPKVFPWSTESTADLEQIERCGPSPELIPRVV